LRLSHAKNEAAHQPLVNVQIARTYLAASDANILEVRNLTWKRFFAKKNSHSQTIGSPSMLCIRTRSNSDPTFLPILAP
jgi:hypothetical protein